MTAIFQYGGNWLLVTPA